MLSAGIEGSLASPGVIRLLGAHSSRVHQQWWFQRYEASRKVRGLGSVRSSSAQYVLKHLGPKGMLRCVEQWSSLLRLKVAGVTI